MEPIIQVKCLKHIYSDKTQVKICGLEFIVNKGERIAILGPNGSGKTTLLAHIIGLLKPVEGTVKVSGMNPYSDFDKLRKKIGVVFQSVDEQIIGPRVYDDIAFAPRNDKYKKEEIDKMVKDVAKLLKIEDLLDKIPHYLSGGQKKKVALAGALVMKPEILILDEPFDSLDPISKKEMINLINIINKEQKVTIITTTHDLNVVPIISDNIYIINDGNIVKKGNAQEVFTDKEVLEKANLEQPILTELFSRLREKGYDVEIPIDISEAEHAITSLLKKH